jgi:hypothetical protein
MKTKSYTIHTESGTRVHVSEKPGNIGITVKIIGNSNNVTLNKEEWKDLCGMLYDLTCYEPEQETSQVPDLDHEYGSSEADMTVETPMADATIAKLKAGSSNGAPEA